jgi:predicted metal-dependent hydrolase
MNYSIQYGSRTIPYLLTYSARKTLGITVTPEMEVLVKSPENASIEKIEALLIKKAPWIIKQLNFFIPFHPKTPKRRYVNGETHLYLGRQYQLKLKPGKENKIGFDGRYMVVIHKPKTPPASILKQWYRERAKNKFAEIAEPLIAKFEKYEVSPSGIYLQEMATRWGSCTPKGRIILNPELIQAPKACIEYVIIHELCHLVHRYHNAKFFDLQQKEMPDWEKWKGRLEKLLA